jgi:hypothetical protein
VPRVLYGTVITSIIKICTSWTHPSQGSTHFPTNSPALSTHFSTFTWQALCRSSKTLLKRRSSPCTLSFSSSSSSAKRRPRSASFSGPSRWKPGGVKSGPCGEDEGTPLLQFPSLYTDCCAVWLWHEGGRLDSSSCWPNTSNSYRTPAAVLTAEFCTSKCSSPFSGLHSARHLKPTHPIYRHNVKINMIKMKL